MINNPVFDPDYVLSEPDTLVADICHEFEEKEYNFIKRKLSDHHEEFEDETETNIHLRTSSSRKLVEKDNHDDMTMKFKRRISFEYKSHE